MTKQTRRRGSKREKNDIKKAQTPGAERGKAPQKMQLLQRSQVSSTSV